jgi:hypothetical protein
MLAVMRMPPMDVSNVARPIDVSGTAALAICESLLLALNDRDILPEAEIVDILKDAAAAHHHAASEDDRAELHAAVPSSSTASSPAATRCGADDARCPLGCHRRAGAGPRPARPRRMSLSPPATSARGAATPTDEGLPDADEARSHEEGRDRALEKPDTFIDTEDAP